MWLTLRIFNDGTAASNRAWICVVNRSFYFILYISLFLKKKKEDEQREYAVLLRGHGPRRLPAEKFLHIVSVVVIEHRELSRQTRPEVKKKKMSSFIRWKGENERGKRSGLFASTGTSP